MALIEPLISPIVRGYTELYSKQKSLRRLKDGKKDEFFGLRDFYRCECFECFNITCTNQIKRCMITLNKRPVYMNVYNDEPIASPCKCPYKSSLDFRYQIYGIRIFFLKSQAVLVFHQIHVALSLDRFLLIYQS